MRWLQRLLRAFAWVSSLLIITWLSASLLDRLWFRSTVPISFADCKWSGTWKTQRYMGMSGRLLVRLPEPLPENEEFKAEALVYYPIYSVWKTGQFVRMDFIGRYSASSAMSAGETDRRPEAHDPMDVKKKGGMLHFKGKAGNQVVEYSALVDVDQTRILGGYLSSKPTDYGFFSMERW